MRKVFLNLEAKIFWQLSSFSLHNSDVLRSAARLLVMTSARGCREGRRAIAAFEGPFVGVLVHVLEQVPLGWEAPGWDADLALVRLEVVRGVHRKDVEPEMNRDLKTQST